MFKTIKQKLQLAYWEIQFAFMPLSAKDWEYVYRNMPVHAQLYLRCALSPIELRQIIRRHKTH